MATLNDALELVSDRDYVARWGSSTSAMRELHVGLIVEELKRRGAFSDDHAQTLARKAVERLGGQTSVIHRVENARPPGELRLWIPADELRD
jgi:hypothetical protein